MPSDFTGRWVWVSLPYATFGLEIVHGRVRTAAPIAAWTIGRSEEFVAGYYRWRRAKFVPLDTLK